MKLFALLVCIVLIFLAPFSSTIVRKYRHKWKLTGDRLMLILVTVFALSITSYSVLMYVSAQFLLKEYKSDFLLFLNEPLTGKGLVFFATIIYSIYAGWNFLLYPLIRDFEQMRDEARKQKSKQEKPKNQG